MGTIDETHKQTSESGPVQTVDSARVGPRLKFDEHGHAIPPTKEEMAETHKALVIALAEMAAIPDDPPGSDEECWRAIDAGRPERPLFREFYEP